MVAPLSKKVHPEEIAELMRDANRIHALGSWATTEDRLIFQETKVNILRRIARHPGQLDPTEAVEVAVLAEEEADELQEMLDAEGGV